MSCIVPRATAQTRAAPHLNWLDHGPKSISIFQLRVSEVAETANTAGPAMPAAGDSVESNNGVGDPSPEPTVNRDGNGNLLLISDAEVADLPQPDLSVENMATDEASDPVGPAMAHPGANSRLQLVARLDSQFTYDDNIFIRRLNRQSDLIFSLSPTIALGLGDVRPEFKRVAQSAFDPALMEQVDAPRNFLFARYTPRLTLFFDHDGEDALDHDAAAQGQWQHAYLTLGFQTRYQTLSDPDVDVGGRTRRSIFSQALTATYDYSDRTAFAFQLGGSIRHYPDNIDAEELVMDNAVNYRVGSRTTVGLGVTAGWLEVEDTGTQIYEQLTARARYQMTEKIDVGGSVGVEVREIRRWRQSRVEPVFELTANYAPSDSTILTLSAARRLENSAGAADLDIISSAVEFNIRQRFAHHYYIGLIGSFLSNQYIDLTSRDFSRDDQVLSIQPYLKMDVTKSSAIELGYRYRHDSSTIDRFTFGQNQAFLHVDILF